PAFDALPHLRAGNGGADYADTGRYHIDKGTVDDIGLLAELNAKEGGCGQIKGQLFDGRIELEIGTDPLSRPLQVPLGNTPRDRVVERPEIGLHRRWLEGDPQRLAV